MSRARERNRPKRDDFVVPNVIVPPSGLTTFSFKHLHRDHSRFSVDLCTRDFWQALAKELQRYSCMKFSDFWQDAAEDHRHFVKFEDTTCPGGFEQLDSGDESIEPFQFAIGSAADRWRVISFALDETFYIVWLDPQHALYK